jgi:hypothetical protein
VLRGDRIRIYYFTRNADMRGFSSFIEVDAHDPARVHYVHPDPILTPGKPGTFDEDGAGVSCAVMHEGRMWLYYTGYSRCASVPYRVASGVAVSDDGVNFSRMFEGPIIDRTPLEPHTTHVPYVIKGPDRWRMWYGSGVRWVEIDGRMELIYVIKYGESRDGIQWDRPNVTCIVPLHDLEANIRPSVLPTKDGYEMWFGYRHSRDFRDGEGSYRIGYAVSSDGRKWRRMADPPGLAPSGSGWNRVMMAYPNVIVVGGRKLLFHNGDGFGTSGMGYAVWQDEPPQSSR